MTKRELAVEVWNIREDYVKLFINLQKSKANNQTKDFAKKDYELAKKILNNLLKVANELHK